MTEKEKTIAILEGYLAVAAAMDLADEKQDLDEIIKELKKELANEKTNQTMAL